MRTYMAIFLAVVMLFSAAVAENVDLPIEADAAVSVNEIAAQELFELGAVALALPADCEVMQAEETDGKQFCEIVLGENMIELVDIQCDADMQVLWLNTLLAAMAETTVSEKVELPDGRAYVTINGMIPEGSVSGSDVGYPMAGVAVFTEQRVTFAFAVVIEGTQEAAQALLDSVLVW